MGERGRRGEDCPDLEDIDSVCCLAAFSTALVVSSLLPYFVSSLSGATHLYWIHFRLAMTLSGRCPFPGWSPTAVSLILAKDLFILLMMAAPRDSKKTTTSSSTSPSPTPSVTQVRNTVVNGTGSLPAMNLFPRLDGYSQLAGRLHRDFTIGSSVFKPVPFYGHRHHPPILLFLSWASSSAVRRTRISSR